jgi:thiol-disulfide isomerase/thioredoxin
LIKKQIGLLAIIAFIVTFMAFTGVASAQTSNAQITFFTQPGCAACQAAEPIVNSAAAKYGVAVTVVDLSTTVVKNIARATGGITTTPTIIVSGAQSATFVGSVTQAQLESSITAAKGTATPAAKATVAATPAAKATVAATPAAKATVAATTTPKATVAATTTPKATVAATTTPKATVAATTTPQPKIVVATTTPTTTTSTQTVPEFSLLGLGAPALLVGAIYLFLRRQ